MNKDWIKVENFISKDTAKLLYQYIKFGNERLSFLKSKGITVASDIYGMFNDPQSEGDLKSPVFAMYGDLIFDTLMVNNLEKIENIIEDKEKEILQAKFEYDKKLLELNLPIVFFFFWLCVSTSFEFIWL